MAFGTNKLGRNLAVGTAVAGLAVLCSAATPQQQTPASAPAQQQQIPDAPRPQMPRFRVVKERRATFVATAQQEARRPGAGTALAGNLALAGDWTDTGLPATIEGAIRSGRTAAATALAF